MPTPTAIPRAEELHAAVRREMPTLSLATVLSTKGERHGRDDDGRVKRGNEVCPSKWKDEGDKTLVNPGAKMVGKVHEALQGA